MTATATRYEAELTSLVGRNVELTEDSYETSVEGELQHDGKGWCVEHEIDGEKHWGFFDPASVTNVVKMRRDRQHFVIFVD